MMDRKEIVRTIYEAKNEKLIVRANIRLKKNGRFSSIEGVVKEVKINHDGNPYIVIQPIGRHIQSVVFSNIMYIEKQPPVTVDRLQKMIAERAYYNAKQHNFLGNPIENWLTAEREVKSVVQVR